MHRLKLLILITFASFLIIVLIFIFRPTVAVDQASSSTSPTRTVIFEQATQTVATVSEIENTPSPTVEMVTQETDETTASTEDVPPVEQTEVSVEEALYQASLQFLAETPEEANEIARKIDFLVGESEDACNMCGPLSIAILKEAGLLPAEANTHDAWLLCARENREDCFGMDTLKKVFFPPDEYEYLRVYESVRDYDFKSNPLQPGDWLYLFTYTHGYDHMLVVTRVDDEGNPYTVTNVDWGDGFIISEMKLYDVDDPQDGLFYELTKIERRRIGMMGTEGFLLVRKIGGIIRLTIPRNYYCNESGSFP
jgi:hypothetical protein